MNHVSNFLKSDRKEFSETGQEGKGANMFMMHKPDFKVDYFYHDLQPKDKRLFEMTTGYNTGKTYKNKEIMKSLNMNQNQVSYAKKRLKDRLNKVLDGNGI